MKGTIFDIQPGAMHDGPGIRSTVFLKGCPLRCQWCSNPESFLKRINLSYNRDRCTNCLECVPVCKYGALTSHEDSLLVQHNLCNACGKCIEVCPSNALKLYGYTADAKSIVKQVLKDKAYFDKSGGGITLSGGEAMMQPEFTLEILKESKKAGLHTCLETCGFASQSEYEAIIPYVDLFLFDYKATGGVTHLSLTKQPDQKILSNLVFLDAHHAQIVLRCPIVPGMNDTTDHFQAINELGKTLNNIIEIELMPYHNFGEHKYVQIGLEKPGLGTGPAGEKLLEQWNLELMKLDCDKLKPTSPVTSQRA